MYEPQIEINYAAHQDHIKVVYPLSFVHEAISKNPEEKKSHLFSLASHSTHEGTRGTI